MKEKKSALQRYPSYTPPPSLSHSPSIQKKKKSKHAPLTSSATLSSHTKPTIWLFGQEGGGGREGRRGLYRVRPWTTPIFGGGRGEGEGEGGGIAFIPARMRPYPLPVPASAKGVRSPRPESCDLMAPPSAAAGTIKKWWVHKGTAFWQHKIPSGHQEARPPKATCSPRAELGGWIAKGYRSAVQWR